MGLHMKLTFPTWILLSEILHPSVHPPSLSLPPLAPHFPIVSRTSGPAAIRGSQGTQGPAKATTWGLRELETGWIFYPLSWSLEIPGLLLGVSIKFLTQTSIYSQHYTEGEMTILKASSTNIIKSISPHIKWVTLTCSISPKHN